MIDVSTNGPPVFLPPTSQRPQECGPMATTNPSTMIERAAEVRHLASAIFAETFGLDWEDALAQADRQVDALLHFAEQWDAQAEPKPLAAPADILYMPEELD